MLRKPIIAGNWKMYKTHLEAKDLVKELKEKALPAGVEVVLCPPLQRWRPSEKSWRDGDWQGPGSFLGKRKSLYREVSPAI